MAEVTIRPREECRYDLVSLGEIMLRLDPGEMRIRTARSFRAWEGGGEYNVARGLRRCFGLRTAVVTALADNEVGRLIEDLVLQGDVDTDHIRWVPYDGCGRTVRNGLNFTERGFGVRGPLGMSDRGHTAASQMRTGEVDWDRIFGELGARWFHTGGIYAALSETTPDVIEEAMAAARRHGTVVSYDLNYRPSLWDRYGGLARAQEVNRRLASHVDVMLGVGSEGNFSAAFGFGMLDADPGGGAGAMENFAKMVASLSAEYPNFRVVASTLRTVRSALVHDWSALAWQDGDIFESVSRLGLDILDRVGGGDGFAAGLIYGLLEKADIQAAVEYGAAHGALAMTTPGDTSMATLAEVEALVNGEDARVQR